MKILSLTRYSRLGASSRLRSHQYFPYLQRHGIQVTAAPLFNDEYIENLYAQKPANLRLLIVSFLRRLKQLIKVRGFDLLWIEKELLPWFPAWGEEILARLNIPYIVDYDDAAFHNYNLHRNSLVRFLMGHKINVVMRRASMVIVGNDYIGDYARHEGARRVEYLPTVIDLDRYSIVPKAENEIFTIGWIGSPITAKYLNLVQPVLEELCKNNNAKLILIGSGDIGLNGVPLDVRRWSEKTESADILDFDVGIMPIPDGPWERGKCGYKLIQYMASGRPVVASLVGVNLKIVENGVNGFLANTVQEWENSLRTLREKRDLRERMGKAGRSKVEHQYCLQVTAPRLVSLFHDVIKEFN